METFTATLKQCCQTQLNNLKARLPETQWAVVATADGHVVASTAKAAANYGHITEVALDTCSTQAESATTQRSCYGLGFERLSLSIARELALGSMGKCRGGMQPRPAVFCSSSFQRDGIGSVFHRVYQGFIRGQALWSVQNDSPRKLAIALS